MNNLSPQSHSDNNPIIMIYGELSTDDDSCLSSSSHDGMSKSPVKKCGRKTASSVEVSEFVYFTKLNAARKMVGGIEELNNKLPLVTQITQDRTDEEKRIFSKKHLRRRLRNKKISQRGNTANARINPKTQVHTEADHAAGGVPTKTTPVRDESRAARSAWLSSHLMLSPYISIV